MREKQIEQKLVRTVKDLGGICSKLVCPGMDRRIEGVPYESRRTRP